MIAALGMEASLRWMSRRGLMTLPGLIARRISPPALAALVVIGYSAQSTLSDYFTIYVNDPMTAYWLEANNAALAREVEAVPAASVEHTWLEDRLTRGQFRPSVPVPARGCWPDVHRPAGGPDPGARLHRFSVRPQSRLGACARGSAQPVRDPDRAGGQGAGRPRDFTACGVCASHRAPPAASITAAPATFAAQFERGITLRAAELISTGGASYLVRLRWSGEQPIDRDYAVFVQWFRPGGGPAPVAQADSSPAAGYLPMPWWRPGGCDRGRPSDRGRGRLAAGATRSRSGYTAARPTPA